MSLNENQYLRFQISIEESSLEDIINIRLDKMAKSKHTKLKGFMPGKAPLSLIKDKFYTETRQQVLQEWIHKECESFTIKQGLNLKDTCLHTVTTLPNNQGKLDFLVIIYLMSPINLEKMKNLSIERPIVPISESDIEEKIQHLRIREATWQLVSRKIQYLDKITFIVVNTNIYTVPCGHTFSIIVGTGHFMYDFEKSLIGHEYKDRDFLTIETNAGWFLISIISVEEGTINNNCPEFLTKLGFKNEEELKESLRQHMIEQVAIISFHQMKDQAIKNLVILDNLELNVPTNMLERAYAKDHKINQIHKNPVYVYNLKEAWLLYLLEQSVVSHEKDIVSIESLSASEKKLILSFGFPEDRCAVLFQQNFNEKDISKYLSLYRSIEHLLKHVTIIDQHQTYEEFIRKNQILDATNYRLSL